MCCKLGGLARETSIKVSPYGTSLLMGYRFGVVIGLQARFDEAFYLSVRYCTSVRLDRWRGCTSSCYIWWPFAEFLP